MRARKSAAASRSVPSAMPWRTRYGARNAATSVWVWSASVDSRGSRMSGSVTRTRWSTSCSTRAWCANISPRSMTSSSVSASETSS